MAIYTGHTKESNRDDESITTRIETRKRPLLVKAKRIVMMNPLQQGLKLRFRVMYKRISNIVMMNPLQQGLKHHSHFSALL